MKYENAIPVRPNQVTRPMLIQGLLAIGFKEEFKVEKMLPSENSNVEHLVTGRGFLLEWYGDVISIILLKNGHHLFFDSGNANAGLLYLEREEQVLNALANGGLNFHFSRLPNQ
jgi:hypothetical protein